ncbi:hypothetical protein F5X68DRAFT_75652 [Plectosphaerella plurivora]|uniref:Uncharacterized protein n=1 Tax=Plectosphaerella plurivora TaxID=936078 RepID=A0A9P8VDV4_9PEZI|nr:hypothetical protein F5X68DRAFT_75652 [Plectosphaerella plurivora]
MTSESPRTTCNTTYLALRRTHSRPVPAAPLCASGRLSVSQMKRGSGTWAHEQLGHVMHGHHPLSTSGEKYKSSRVLPHTGLPEKARLKSVAVSAWIAWLPFSAPRPDPPPHDHGGGPWVSGSNSRREQVNCRPQVMLSMCFLRLSSWGDGMTGRVGVVRPLFPHPTHISNEARGNQGASMSWIILESPLSRRCTTHLEKQSHPSFHSARFLWGLFWSWSAAAAAAPEMDAEGSPSTCPPSSTR